MISKVCGKILVYFRLVQKFGISDFLIANVEKVNIAVTYACTYQGP
jgi:hypothetical protein